MFNSFLGKERQKKKKLKPKKQYSNLHNNHTLNLLQLSHFYMQYKLVVKLTNKNKI